MATAKEVNTDFDNEAESSELRSISENWKICKKFLYDIKERKLSCFDRDAPVVKAIQEIEEELKRMICPNTGARPKEERSYYRSGWEKDPDTDSESDGSDKRKKKMRRKKREPKYDQIELLTEIVNKLDHRAVPQLEEFDENEGMDLERYIEEFEEHCRENYRGRKHFWLTELGRKLSGRTLDCYKSIRRTEEGYETVKDRLLQWYED